MGEDWFLLAWSVWGWYTWEDFKALHPVLAEASPCPRGTVDRDFASQLGQNARWDLSVRFTPLREFQALNPTPWEEQGPAPRQRGTLPSWSVSCAARFAASEHPYAIRQLWQPLLQ